MRKDNNGMREMLAAKAAEVAAQDPTISVLYLFGSQATGKAGPLSDIDLAVLLNQSYNPQEYFEKRLELLTTMTRSLKKDHLDLVILNQAPIRLTYHIIKDGRVLFSRNEEQRLAFQVRVIGSYLDLKPLWQVNYDYLFRRLKEGRFGG